MNVVIAFALFIWLQITAAFEPVESLTVTAGSFAERLMLVNVSLVLFNLLPAFPKDGGRVVGVLTRSDFLLALAKQGKDAAVAEVMQREFQAIEVT